MAQCNTKTQLLYMKIYEHRFIYKPQNIFFTTMNKDTMAGIHHYIQPSEVKSISRLSSG